MEVDWLNIVLQVINIAEDAAGMQFPRFDASGKLLMPESQSAKLAVSMLDKRDVANALLLAACKADATLHSALTVAALNCSDQDKSRLLDALKEK